MNLRFFGENHKNLLTFTRFFQSFSIFLTLFYVSNNQNNKSNGCSRRNAQNPEGKPCMQRRMMLYGNDPGKRNCG